AKGLDQGGVGPDRKQSRSEVLRDHEGRIEGYRGAVGALVSARRAGRQAVPQGVVMFPRLRRLWLRLVHAARPERAEDELARELSSPLAVLEDARVRQGLSREVAYTEARRRLGGAESVKALHRDARSVRWVDDLRIDTRYALRRLRSRPAT